MDRQRIFYRSSFNVYEFMLKGDRMKRGEGCQESFNIGLETNETWWKRRTKDCPRCRLDGIPIEEKNKRMIERIESRYRPAKIAVSSVNRRKYLKLYNGDIYCVETDTILDRHTLKELLTNLQ